ncbi:MAG: 4Fe-4S binding protein [Desulfobulbaceae bacterium]|nr:4Fe-4S binding protein [Desulfobulbaceae bacterium]HIJ77814.1 4Fe-4S binding protein [Deltaproteobacteria bacterium]
MTWWTRALKSLISAEEERLDLFRIFPGIRRFLAARHHYAYLRTAGDILFVLVVISGLFGPRDPQKNVAVFLAWGVLWPTIVLSWFFVGRMWCGICPFPGLGFFLQRKGLSFSLPVPRLLQKYGVYTSVFLFALIIWTEVVAGLDFSPVGTSYFVLSIVFGAALLGILYPGQAWCRHLCPLGRISGAAATLAITEFRPDYEKCRGCETFACRKGKQDKRGCPVYLGAFNVQNNLHCLVCGHCLPLCDRDSPQLLLRNPYSELIRNKGRYITCSYIVPFLIGSQLARFLRQKDIYAQLAQATAWPDAVLFSLMLLVGFIIMMALIRFGSKLFGITEDPLFGKFSPMVPILIPMAFTGELVYRMGYSSAGLGDFIPTFGRQFGIAILEKTAFSIPDFPVQVLSAFFMMNGAIAGCYILWQYCLKDFEGRLLFKNFIGISMLILGLLLFYLLVIF